jgi:misacylated tRNA(Ala) deacylase
MRDLAPSSWSSHRFTRRRRPARRPGLLRWNGGETRVTGIEAAGGRYWHLLAEQVEPVGAVEAVVDAQFRSLMTQLHTDTHILNALVFQHFQERSSRAPSSTRTAPRAWTSTCPTPSNDRLRTLEPEINDVIRQDLPLRYAYLSEAQALAERGLVRQPLGGASTADGTIRVVEIVGSIARACGGPTWSRRPAPGPSAS